MTTAPVAGEATPVIWRRVEQVMGLPVSVAVRGPVDPGQRDRAWAAVVAELREVDGVFSTWRDDSFVSRLGRGEVTLAAGPPEVAEVLALGEVARRESAGAFDVRRDGVLDPSGVVKGWAVQRASRHLGRLPGSDWCLAAGGDLVAHVAEPSGKPWSIGIEDPHDPTRLVARVPVRRGAVATSGATHRGAHVVDARTGRPATGLASVTVLADDLTTADVDATAAYALGVDGPAWLRSRGRAGVVVDEDGRAVVLSGASIGYTPKDQPRP